MTVGGELPGATGASTEGAGEEATLPLRPVLVLSEEELLVLTDGDLGVVPPRTRLSSAPGTADLVRAVAVRSLMARGLIHPCGTDPHAGQEAVAWEATEPLGLALGLRALAPIVLALHRVLGAHGSDAPPGESSDVPPPSTVATRYLHLHPEVAVIEDVTPEGMHGILTVFPDRYVEAVTDFVTPPDVVAGSGGPRTLTDGVAGAEPGDHPVTRLMAELGDPTVLVEVSLMRVALDGRTEQDGQFMLALGPQGTFWSEDSRTYHPVGPTEVIAELLSRALPSAPEPVRPGQGSGAGAGGPT